MENILKKEVNEFTDEYGNIISEHFFYKKTSSEKKDLYKIEIYKRNDGEQELIQKIFLKKGKYEKIEDYKRENQTTIKYERFYKEQNLTKVYLHKKTDRLSAPIIQLDSKEFKENAQIFFIKIKNKKINYDNSFFSIKNKLVENQFKLFNCKITKNGEHHTILFACQKKDNDLLYAVIDSNGISYCKPKFTFKNIFSCLFTKKTNNIQKNIPFTSYPEANEETYKKIFQTDNILFFNTDTQEHNCCEINRFFLTKMMNTLLKNFDLKNIMDCLNFLTLKQETDYFIKSSTLNINIDDIIKITKKINETIQLGVKYKFMQASLSQIAQTNLKRLEDLKIANESDEKLYESDINIMIKNKNTPITPNINSYNF